MIIRKKEPDFEVLKEYKNNISDELCDSIIEKFENHPEVVTSDEMSAESEGMKDSSVLDISLYHDWVDVTTHLQGRLREAVYSDLSKWFLLANSPLEFVPIANKTFLVQKSIPGSTCYKWHTDNHLMTINPYDDEREWKMMRTLTYIWYLNDDFEEGETEFGDFKVKPEKGSLLVFPSEFSYPHKGNPPVGGNKYILTGWIYRYFDINNDAAVGPVIDGELK